MENEGSGQSQNKTRVRASVCVSHSDMKRKMEIKVGRRSDVERQGGEKRKGQIVGNKNAAKIQTVTVTVLSQQ